MRIRWARRFWDYLWDGFIPVQSNLEILNKQGTRTPIKLFHEIKKEINSILIVLLTLSSKESLQTQLRTLLSMLSNTRDNLGLSSKSRSLVPLKSSISNFSSLWNTLKCGFIGLNLNDLGENSERASRLFWSRFILLNSVQLWRNCS